MLRIFSLLFLLLAGVISSAHAEPYVFQWPTEVSSEPTASEGTGGTGGIEGGSSGLS